MDWTAIIIAAVGGGALSALINAVFNRCKTKADAYEVISGVYEKRLAALTDRATQLEARVEKLEGVIDNLRLEVEERDDMIDSLQRENAKLKAEIKALQAENACKDRKIAKLQAQVKELAMRLDAMNGDGGG